MTTKPKVECAMCASDLTHRALTPVELEQAYLEKRGSTVSELQAYIKDWSERKGWKDDRGFSDLLLLMVTEIAEAVEEYRDWHEPHETRVVAGKPEGIPVELADVVIRVISFCAKYDINLAAAIEQKMAYNETREHRHGNKRI